MTQDASKRQPRVVFLHLPKTGGTTVHDLLKAAFPAERICPERFNNLGRFSDQELREFDFFSGHFDFRNLQRIEKPTYTMTILREPKRRILSLYYYWRAQKDSHIELHGLNGPRLAKRTTLLEFLSLKTQGVPENIDNLYARQLLGQPLHSGDGNRTLGDEDAIALALRNLQSLDEIGFTDRLPDLVARISTRIPIKVPETLPRARSFDGFGKDDPNTEPVQREPITPRIEARLDELVSLDHVIYRRARELCGLPASEDDAR